MTSWLALAIFGHLANAVAFVIDKALLSTAWKRSATYAALIGGFSVVTVVAAPWVKHWPDGFVWPSIVAFGSLFVFGLWGFFEALKRAEATRVVPMIGSLVPLFTIVETMWFLGERLSFLQLVGFFCLLVATILLTGAKRQVGALQRSTILLIVVSALLFATATVFGKYAFDHGDFLAVFVSSRLVAACTGLVIVFLSAGAREELRTLWRSRSKSGQGASSTGLTITGQAFGSAGFVLIHLSIAQGSAAIVNALQAIQYAAIALTAWFGGKWLRRVLHEERTFRVILVKSLAIFLVGIGLCLISFA